MEDKIIKELRKKYYDRTGMKLYHLDDIDELNDIVDELQFGCVCGHVIRADDEIVDLGCDVDEFELPGVVAKCIYCC